MTNAKRNVVFYTPEQQKKLDVFLVSIISNANLLREILGKEYFELDNQVLEELGSIESDLEEAMRIAGECKYKSNNA